LLVGEGPGVRSPAPLAPQREGSGVRFPGVGGEVPLRAAYLVDGMDGGETPAAVFDLLQAMDRRRVTPLVVSYAPGPVADAARQRRISVRVVDRHDATHAYHEAWAAALPPRARRLAQTSPAWRMLCLVGALVHRLHTAREVLALARALLDLRPELLVSTSPRLHVAALLAGRIAGVPVQWHARDAAPAARQPLLNLLARWTTGVLTPTQAAARAYDLRHLGARVRVLRPSITLAPPVTPAQSAALRQALAPDHPGPILTVLAPVSAESGHQDMLDAAMLLLGRYPGLRILLAREALPDLQDMPDLPARNAPDDLLPHALAGVYTATAAANLDGSSDWAPALDDIPPMPSMEATAGRPPNDGNHVSERELRLVRAITSSGLDGIVTDLGPRDDVAELLAASDLAVFPFRQVSASRGLLHALAAGIPVVATDLPALREQLADAWGYTLAEPGDPAALAAAITRALDGLDEYRAAARRNPWLVRDWFDASVELGRLLPLYRARCRPAPPRLPLPRLPLLPHPANIPRRWIAALWAEGE
ncbi:MAG: glycosyltransferase, partial [Ktedonobacterales bacterium]